MKKITGLVIIVLAAMSATLCSAVAATTPQQVAIFEKKLKVHQEDLIEISRNLSRSDAEIAISMIDLTNRYSIELAHIQDLLLIGSLIQGEDDKRRVKPVISSRIESVADGIGLSIKQVNLSLGHLNSQPIIATVIKIRDDLRGLKEILLGSEGEK